jgi:hypothetical protein
VSTATDWTTNRLCSAPTSSSRPEYNRRSPTAFPAQREPSTRRVELQARDVAKVARVERPKPRPERQGTRRDREVDLAAASPRQGHVQLCGAGRLRRSEGGARGTRETGLPGRRSPPADAARAATRRRPGSAAGRVPPARSRGAAPTPSGGARRARRSGSRHRPAPAGDPGYPVLIVTHDPYFLWDDPMTADELRSRLESSSAPERARLLGRILREARDTEVWSFTSPAEIARLWPEVRKNLGNRRAFWEFLFQQWRRLGLLA